MDKDELQPVSPMLPSQEQPRQISGQMEQSGGEGKQFGYVQKYESTKNTTVLMIPGNEADDDDYTPDEEIEVDFSCYNLFVITDEQFKGKCFVVPKNKAISESTPADLMDLADLTPDKIAIVKSIRRYLLIRIIHLQRRMNPTEPFSGLSGIYRSKKKAFGYIFIR